MKNMSFKEIIELLGETDKQPFYTFERIVLTLLEKYLSESNKTIIPYYKLPEGEIDAFLPNGFGNEPKTTIVDIKYTKKVAINNIKEKLIKTAEKLDLAVDGFNLLFIVSIEIKPSDKIIIKEFLQSKKPLINFFIWDLHELDTLFNKYAEFVSSFIPNIEKKALQNIVDKSLEYKDWQKERENLIQKLSEVHKNDDLIIFLGAGISSSAGLPDWSSLLSQLLVSLISSSLPKNIDVTDQEKIILAKSLQGLNNSSPLLEARYVNSGLRDNFESEVSNILYKNIKHNNTSPLIDSIGNLCIPPRGALGVRAIVTYNFDDLIERKLESLNLRYRPIYKDMDIPLKDELGIFHVHGFLPENSIDYEGISESLLVFSEKNYHTLMKEPYFWSNLIQLNFFRENTCLLIGLSGTDPNLRRLLEIAKRKNKIAKHYILLKRTSKKVFIEDFEKNDQQVNTTLIETINSIHHNLQERSFDELGLNVLWYEDYDELPDIIEKINYNRKR
ncbi:hypothetical protein EXU85_03835 [Spirosoma sp. KCTC 42546]|uniref:SIR2 family protein n=1 Tax=Spirosoma sp. KCTC 42546 TaxID=2520506 RepID=UPI0011578313|nr:SIR2 family protein [Spirosoma sp. KCTC 42546]QDK77770.1 hypothetical protein EXU85_03835 [Spirosoma sp. KCTC 42546]